MKIKSKKYTMKGGAVCKQDLTKLYYSSIDVKSDHVKYGIWKTDYDSLKETLNSKEFKKHPEYNKIKDVLIDLKKCANIMCANEIHNMSKGHQTDTEHRSNKEHRCNIAYKSAVKKINDAYGNKFNHNQFFLKTKISNNKSLYEILQYHDMNAKPPADTPTKPYNKVDLTKVSKPDTILSPWVMGPNSSHYNHLKRVPAQGNTSQHLSDYLDVTHRYPENQESSGYLDVTHRYPENQDSSGYLDVTYNNPESKSYLDVSAPPKITRKNKPILVIPEGKSIDEFIQDIIEEYRILINNSKINQTRKEEYNRISCDVIIILLYSKFPIQDLNQLIDHSTYYTHQQNGRNRAHARGSTKKADEIKYLIYKFYIKTHIFNTKYKSAEQKANYNFEVFKKEYDERNKDNDIYTSIKNLSYYLNHEERKRYIEKNKHVLFFCNSYFDKKCTKEDWQLFTNCKANQAQFYDYTNTPQPVHKLKKPSISKKKPTVEHTYNEITFVKESNNDREKDFKSELHKNFSIFYDYIKNISKLEKQAQTLLINNNPNIISLKKKYDELRDEILQIKENYLHNIKTRRSKTANLNLTKRKQSRNERNQEYNLYLENKEKKNQEYEEIKNQIQVLEGENNIQKEKERKKIHTAATDLKANCEEIISTINTDIDYSKEHKLTCCDTYIKEFNSAKDDIMILIEKLLQKVSTPMAARDYRSMIMY